MVRNSIGSKNLSFFLPFRKRMGSNVTSCHVGSGATLLVIGTVDCGFGSVKKGNGKSVIISLTWFSSGYSGKCVRFLVELSIENGSYLICSGEHTVILHAGDAHCSLSVGVLSTTKWPDWHPYNTGICTRSLRGKWLAQGGVRVDPQCMIGSRAQAWSETMSAIDVHENAGFEWPPRSGCGMTGMARALCRVRGRCRTRRSTVRTNCKCRQGLLSQRRFELSHSGNWFSYRL